MWNTSGWLLPLACVLSTAVRSGDAALAAQNEALDQDDTCVLLQHYSSAPNARSRRAVASPGEQGDALQRVRDRSEKLEAKLEQVQDTDARGAAEELYKGMREVQAVLQKYPNEDKQLQFRGDMRFYPATSSSGFTRDSARLHQEVMASWSWKAPTGQAPRVSAGNQESELVATRADAKAESKGGPLQVILGVWLIVCFCCMVLCAMENQVRGVQRTPSSATGRSPQGEQGVYHKSLPQLRRDRMFNAQLMASIRRGSDQQGAASSPGWRDELVATDQNTHRMASMPEPVPASNGVNAQRTSKREIETLDSYPPTTNSKLAKSISSKDEHQYQGNRTSIPGTSKPFSFQSVTTKETEKSDLEAAVEEQTGSTKATETSDLEAAVAEQTDLRSQAVRDLQARLRNLHQEVSRGQRTPKESDHDDFGPSS
mmetsp:Transcript_86946/g.158814  ORF Transcript_86946/g.158814 Transcript_86946/m.158814 type:complete len:428 (+) Transcript_86946:94-1377(+)